MQVTAISCGTVCCFWCSSAGRHILQLMWTVKRKFTKQLKTKIKGGVRNSLQEPFLQILPNFSKNFSQGFHILSSIIVSFKLIYTLLFNKIIYM